MNKLFTKIATACVGLAMAVGVGVAIGNNDRAEKIEAVSVGDTFRRISSLDIYHSGKFIYFEHIKGINNTAADILSRNNF